MSLVSLSPSLTETLLALGCPPAGITGQCPSAMGAVRIGEPKALDFEALAALHPALILADSRDNRPDELKRLAAMFRVVCFEVTDPRDVPGVIRQVGDLCGRSKEAGIMAGDLEMEILKPFPAGVNLSRAVLLLWNVPYLTVNHNTYASRLLEAAGAMNLFGRDPVPEIALDLDDFIDLPMDLLLLAADPYVFREKDVVFFRSFEAFRDVEILLAEGRWFSIYGPRTMEALRGLRRIMKQNREKKAIS